VHPLRIPSASAPHRRLDLRPRLLPHLPLDNPTDPIDNPLDRPIEVSMVVLGSSSIS
jgi:hypothetical protein